MFNKPENFLKKIAFFSFCGIALWLNPVIQLSSVHGEPRPSGSRDERPQTDSEISEAIDPEPETLEQDINPVRSGASSESNSTGVELPNRDVRGSEASEGELVPDPDSSPNSPTLTQEDAFENPFLQPTTIRGTPERSNGEDLATKLEDSRQLRTLAAVLGLADLIDPLKDSQTWWIVFAPTDQVFETDKVYPQLLQSDNRAQLVQFLQKHLVKGEISTETFEQGEAITLGNGIIKLEADPDNPDIIVVNGVKIDKSISIEATNGRIFPIEQAIFQPDL
ncbi:MAG: fasciclin domain-containing protein [Microcoleaceae cyanobacterium]